jgi:hypothetical protein
MNLAHPQDSRLPESSISLLSIVFKVLASEVQRDQFLTKFISMSSFLSYQRLDRQFIWIKCSALTNGKYFFMLVSQN